MPNDDPNGVYERMAREADTSVDGIVRVIGHVSEEDLLGSLSWYHALPLEVHAIRLAADAAIVTLPGEVFVEHALAIKKGSPFKTTLVIELANADEPGYIPTREQNAGGGELLVAAVLKLLQGF